MDYISLLSISIGLAMDAFAASITNGSSLIKAKLFIILKVSACFGIFQAIMPMIGWFIGKTGEGLISRIDHWVAFGLLCYIGGRMIFDAYRGNHQYKSQIKSKDIALKLLLLLSVATSIDALATGVILPSAVGAHTITLMLLATCTIGVITFSMSICGSYIGYFLGAKFEVLKQKYFFFNPNIIGGVILICIGIKILIEHISMKGVS